MDSHVKIVTLTALCTCACASARLSPKAWIWKTLMQESWNNCEFMQQIIWKYAISTIRTIIIYYIHFSDLTFCRLSHHVLALESQVLHMFWSRIWWAQLETLAATWSNPMQPERWDKKAIDRQRLGTFSLHSNSACVFNSFISWELPRFLGNLFDAKRTKTARALGHQVLVRFLQKGRQM